MKKTTALSLVIAAALGFGAMTMPGATAADSVIRISTSQTKSVTAEKGKPLTIRTDKSYYEVVVGDPEIATVQPLTNRSFYVLGNAAGTTGIAFFDENQRLVGSIDLEVSVDTSRLKKALAENVPDSNIEVRTSNGQVVLSGSAPDKVSADLANELAKKFADGEDDVINSVSITSSQQVQLNVRFVEVNRTAGKELGTEIGIQNNASGSSGGFSYSAGELIGNFIADGLNIDYTITAMEKRGVARRLAEPNLVTRSGQKAEFLAGGEYPIAARDEDGRVEITYKKFGVSLEFLPTVLKDGLISLEIAPEVSSIDGSDGFEYPIFRTRRAKTSVDLKSGQSFMIAGLFQAENTTGAENLPGIGRMPIIGALFSSKEFKREETDLVMIVTPHLVRPVDPTKPMATPHDGSRSATEAESVLLQIDEVKTASTGPTDPNRTSGHILTLDIAQ